MTIRMKVILLQMIADDQRATDNMLASNRANQDSPDYDYDHLKDVERILLKQKETVDALMIFANGLDVEIEQEFVVDESLRKVEAG